MNKKNLKNLTIIIGIFFILVFSLSIIHSIKPLSFLQPGVAHASLHDDLTPPGGQDTQWLFSGVSNGSNTTTVGVWSLMLGLANVFVAIVLFFFAFVNIAHIQYDTYQLKKVLPGLIIGIVLANFSMLICRFLIDIASVIALTFSKDPAGLGRDLMCAFRFSTNNGFGDFALLIVQGGGLGGLIMALLLAIVISLGIIILSMLMWVRKVVLYLLAATAPLAFIMMAFPPTEPYFKKWWDWEIKYVFMGPIMIFILWVAGKIGFTNCSGDFSLTTLFAAVGLIYLAAAVPFMLGGGAMALANKIGKSIGKKAWDNPWSNRKKEMAGNAIKQRFYGGTKLGRWMERGTRTDESILEAQKHEAETRQGQRDLETSDKVSDRVGKAKERLARLKVKLETAGNEKLAKHMLINIDAITDTDLASQKAQRAVDQIKKKGLEAAYNDTVRGEQLINEDIEDAKVTRDLDRAKKSQMKKAYEDNTRGKQLIANEIEDIKSTGEVEKAKNDRTAEYYLGSKGKEMAEFESGIANSQMKVDKIKDDQRVLMAVERLAGHEILHDNLIKKYDAGTGANLENSYKDVDRLTMDLANASPADQAAAQAALDAALTSLEAKKTAFSAHLVASGVINPDTNTAFTTADAPGFIDKSHLQRYERTRHMAIIGKRTNDDASVDAQSMSSGAIAQNLVDKTAGKLKGGSYGPYVWTEKGAEDFWHGKRSADGRAGALGIATQVDAIKRSLQNNQTRGAALQDYSQIINAGNPEALEAHINIATHKMNPNSVKNLKKQLEFRGYTGTGPGGEFSPSDIREILTKTTLDTTTPSSPEGQLALQLINSLQQNDDMEMIDPVSNTVLLDSKGKPIRGFTGLGRQSHYYGRNG